MHTRKLIGAKDWFGLFAAGSPSPALLISRGNVIYANAAATELCGLDTAAGVTGLQLSSLLEPELVEKLAQLAAAGKQGTADPVDMAGKLKTAQGPRFTSFNAWTSNLDGENLVVLRVQPEANAQLEEKLRRTDREFRLLSSTLAMMLTATDEETMLQEFCRLSVSLAGYKLAWVGLARNDDEKAIEPVAQAGLENDFFSTLRFSWTEENQPPGQGPWATAVRSGRPCVVRNLLENPVYPPWREAAVRRGFESTASFPLNLGEETGVLSLCDGAGAAFDDKEIMLLEQVAGALSYGIISLRSRAQRLDTIEKLRSAKEFISAFLDHSPLSFCVMLPDGHILMANPRWRELFGCREAPQQSTPVVKLVGQDSAKYLGGICREVMQARKALHFEHKVKLPHGQRYIRATGFPLRDAAGRVTGIGCILDDITDRHRQMAALRASQRGLAHAERLAGLGHWELNVATGQGIWSRNMYRVFDAEPGNPDFQTLPYFADKLLHPDDRERVLRQLDAAREGKAEYDTEYRIRWRDGQIRHICARGVLVRDSSGQVKRMIGTVHDITELRQEQTRLAESRDELKFANDNLRRANQELEGINRQLRESEQRYQNLVEQSPEGIAIAFQGKVVFCNQALAVISGYEDPAELLGRPLASLIHEEDRASFMTAMVKLSSPGQVSPLIELRGKRTDGKPLDLALRMALVERDGGASIQATISDVSQSRKLERQVQQMQKMEAVGLLASGIAHDFNNILFAILGYADLLKDQVEAQSAALEDLSELRAAGLRGKELVSQLLLFTRQAEHELKALSLSGAVKDALKFLRATLPATISIRSHLLDSGDLVMANPTQLHQVLLNLCTNAWHAMPDGGELEVSVQPLEVDEEFAAAHEGLQAGSTLLLRISDSGSGMSRETVDRIFEPFFTTKEPGVGTGLGLSVVYGIIKSIGGTIHVYSELGQGTSFHIYLPRQTEAAAAERAPSAESRSLHGTERVLVVDDDESLMKMVSRILIRLGYQVSAFSNAHEALAAFRESPDDFDLVFTDHTMPGLTGMQFARAVLRLRPRLPVILATGFAHHHLNEEALVAGVAQVVTKPLVAEALAEAVRSSLDSAAGPKS